MVRTRIAGTGCFLPERVVTNDDLAKIITTSDEWIQQRTGVKERRYVKEGDGPSSIALQASLRAIEDAGLQVKDIDFIILATQTPEAGFPGVGCFLQEKLGTPGVATLDVRCQCTGFLYGLSIADCYIRLGEYRNVLLIGTEVHSTGLDYSDRSRHITVLFGDGAGAVVLSPTDEDDKGIRKVILHADGRFAQHLIVPSPNSARKPRISHKDLDEGLHYPRMDGKVVFKFAVQYMSEVVREVLDSTGLAMSDIDYFIPHQANMRITEAVAANLGIDPSKVDNSIQRYGNCAAASVPIALHEALKDGRVKEGSTVIFSTFAAGFTWGGALIKF